MTPACHRIYNIRSLSRYLTHSPPIFRATCLVASTQTTSLKWSTARTQGRSFTDSTGPEAPRNPTEHVVVLGGGITGLATAFHLSRRIPQAKITLIENQDRVGGWIRSERVELGPGKGHIVLEAGPRTLRPHSQALLELVHPHSPRYEITSNTLIDPPAWPRTRPNNHFQNLSRSSQPLPLPAPSRRERSHCPPVHTILNLHLALSAPPRAFGPPRTPSPTKPYPPGARESRQARRNELQDESLRRRVGRRVPLAPVRAESRPGVGHCDSSWHLGCGLARAECTGEFSEFVGC